MSLNLEILDILINCEYPPSCYRNFQGKTRAELRRLSLDDLESLLRSNLPPNPARSSLVARFITSLFNPEEGQGQPPSLSATTSTPIIPVDVKQEVKQEVYSPPPTLPETETSRDNDLVEEVQQQENGPEGQNIVQQNIPVQGTGPNASHHDPDMEIVDEDVFIIGIVDAETRDRVVDDIILQDDDDEETPLPPQRPCKRKSTIKPDLMSAKSARVEKKTVFTLGQYPIKDSPTTRRIEWTPAEFRDLTSPAQSPFVETLSILSNCKFTLAPTSSSSSSSTISLPNLKILKIHHRLKSSDDVEAALSSCDINYSQVLVQILAGSPSLTRIEINYEGEMALTTLLRDLASVPELPSLTSLLIQHCGDEDDLATLGPKELVPLGQIKAPHLADLNLVTCISADGDGVETNKAAFEWMLSQFPNLTSLKIQGCFTTLKTPWPRITLDFPKLTHLQVLDLGETDFELEQEVDGIAPQGLIDDKLEDCITVSINFHGLMPSLKSISLGALYELNTFYFTELPSLKIFRVATEWDESFPECFPKVVKKGLEIPQISKVEQLQFPDFFQDCSLISKIIPHFPNLTHIYINFPTVKFLRAFAKTMQQIGPETFKHLEILTQFDFASSLDSCVFDKICEPSETEKKKLEVLKAYPHWKDFVLENEIELPPTKTECEEEDPNEFCGLKVLFEKLDTISFSHRPRTLRIPQGSRHWINDPTPEFTDTIIGFKEYPFNKEIIKRCPSELKITCHDMSKNGEGVSPSPPTSSSFSPFSGMPQLFPATAAEVDPRHCILFSPV